MLLFRQKNLLLSIHLNRQGRAEPEERLHPEKDKLSPSTNCFNLQKISGIHVFNFDRDAGCYRGIQYCKEFCLVHGKECEFSCKMLLHQFMHYLHLDNAGCNRVPWKVTSINDMVCIEFNSGRKMHGSIFCFKYLV